MPGDNGAPAKMSYHSALPAILFHYRVIEPLNKVCQEKECLWTRLWVSRKM